MSAMHSEMFLAVDAWIQRWNQGLFLALCHLDTASRRLKEPHRVEQRRYKDMIIDLLRHAMLSSEFCDARLYTAFLTYVHGESVLRGGKVVWTD